MAKFVIVDKAPEQLRKDEYVIEQPTFIEQISENAGKAPRTKLTATNHLRNIAGSIGFKYDPEGLSAWTIRPHLFEGRKFETNEDLSKIVVEMLENQYPKIFDAYLDHQIKNRPTGCKLIYYVGPFSRTASFSKNGIDQIDAKDVDVYLGLKPKKVVGKPAVTKEEAQNE